jgi:hypothetical protein
MIMKLPSQAGHYSYFVARWIGVVVAAGILGLFFALVFSLLFASLK